MATIVAEVMLALAKSTVPTVFAAPVDVIVTEVAVPFESGTAALSRSYMAFMMEANF